jgi:hypothetical protein
MPASFGRAMHVPTVQRHGIVFLRILNVNNNIQERERARKHSASLTHTTHTPTEACRAAGQQFDAAGPAWFQRQLATARRQLTISLCRDQAASNEDVGLSIGRVWVRPSAVYQRPTLTCAPTPVPPTPVVCFVVLLLFVLLLFVCLFVCWFDVVVLHASNWH